MTEGHGIVIEPVETTSKRARALEILSAGKILPIVDTKNDLEPILVRIEGEKVFFFTDLDGWRYEEAWELHDVLDQAEEMPDEVTKYW